jgi:hypothetical protein
VNRDDKVMTRCGYETEAAIFSEATKAFTGMRDIEKREKLAL